MAVNLRGWLTVPVVLAGCVQSPAQLSRETANRPVEMTVTLSFDDGSPLRGSVTGMNTASEAGRSSGAAGGEHTRDAVANLQIRVQLQESSGSILEEKSPTAEGRVSFRVRNGGEFRIRVIGPEIDEAISENLVPAFGDRMVSILLHRKNGAKVEQASGTMIASKRLRAPEPAKKELDKGTVALGKKDYAGAKQAFEKALQLYPDYDLAYNNLGVVLMQLGDAEGGERAFAKAVELNGSFPRALINLAKVELSRKDYSRAEGYLQKAVTSDPLNAQAYFLLSQVHFFSGRFDETIADVKKLHELPHAEYAMAHYLAGKAFSAKGAKAGAVRELQTFLSEDPKDANVGAAQQLLKGLEQQ